MGGWLRCRFEYNPRAASGEDGYAPATIVEIDIYETQNESAAPIRYFGYTDVDGELYPFVLHRHNSELDYGRACGGTGSTSEAHGTFDIYNKPLIIGNKYTLSDTSGTRKLTLLNKLQVWVEKA